MEMSIRILVADPEMPHIAGLEQACGGVAPIPLVFEPFDLAESVEIDVTDRPGVLVISVAGGGSCPAAAGWDRLRELRGRYPEVPILVLADSDDLEVLIEAVGVGADDCLGPGEDLPRRFTRAVAAMVGRRCWLDQIGSILTPVPSPNDTLERVLDQVSDGVFVNDDEGMLLYLNQAAENLLGRTRDALLGQPIQVATHQATGAEVEITRPSGSKVLARMRINRIPWQGTPATLTTLRDITNDSSVGEVLSQAAEEWQSTFNSVEDMIVVLGRNRRVLRANRAAQTLFGDQALFHRPCYQLFHGTDHPLPGCPIDFTFLTGEARHIEFREDHLGGRWFQASCYPIKAADGTVSKVVHVMRDITESKNSEQMQRSLEAKKLVLEELEQLNEMKSQFIEVSAHEMRTPMTVIRSGVELLMNRTLGDINPRQQEFLQVIERNIDRLARFATDVMNLARLDSGSYPIRPEAISVEKALRPTLDMLKIKGEEKGIELHFDAEESASLQVFADRDALSQVIFNLVNNVLMHCPSGTRVIVAAQAQQSKVAIEVSDSGPGIPPSELERIFERFYQVGRKNGPGYNGTGIGLTIVKALVEKMNGTIAVASTPGEGTSFTVTLPTVAEKNEVLFGRIAEHFGFVRPDQIRSAVLAQLSKQVDRKIGEILVQDGVMTQDQVDRVLEQQRANLARPHPRLPSTMGDGLLGRMAVRYGYMTWEQLSEALCVQAMLSEEGQEVRLGQVLIDKGLMNREDVLALLHSQRQRLAVCPACSRRYNIQRHEQGATPRCPQCDQPLEILEIADDLNVVDSLVQP